MFFFKWFILNPALRLVALARIEDIDLPVFSLNVTGELRIVKDEISERRPWAQRFQPWLSLANKAPAAHGLRQPQLWRWPRSSASGWVSIEVQGEVPNLAGITLPEEAHSCSAHGPTKKCWSVGLRISVLYFGQVASEEITADFPCHSFTARFHRCCVQRHEKPVDKLVPMLPENSRWSEP